MFLHGCDQIKLKHGIATMDGSAAPRIFRRAENSASMEWTVEPSHQEKKN
jgi:hypothetical protein